MICEFNEILGLDGRLIKVGVSDIFKNKDIQACISPPQLLIIGTTFGSHSVSRAKFQLRKIDLQEMTVVLESASERISIKISDLLLDTALVWQVNSVDILRIMSIYFPEHERNMMEMLRSTKRSDSASACNETQQTNSNIISLF